MLIRPADRPLGDNDWRRFVMSQGFGHFIAPGSGRPVPAVVPTQFVLTGTEPQGGEVIFHLAVGNPVLDALAERADSLLSVAGDWTFIPGSWKAIGDEDPRLGIPTTFYGAVQLTGPSRVITDPDGVAEVLRLQLGDVDPDGDWVDPVEHGARLAAIRAVRLEVREVRAKFKYGGNLDPDHRRAIATRLEAREGPGDSAALARLRLLD